MLEFCEYVDQWHKERYYKILVAVLDRGELGLSQMEIDEDHQRDSKIFENKKTVAAACQKFMYNSLEHAVKMINAKGIEDYKQKFVSKAITTSFFRVPQFRAFFLKAVQTRKRADAYSDSML